MEEEMVEIISAYIVEGKVFQERAQAEEVANAQIEDRPFDEPWQVGDVVYYQCHSLIKKGQVLSLEPGGEPAEKVGDSYRRIRGQRMVVGQEDSPFRWTYLSWKDSAPASIQRDWRNFLDFDPAEEGESPVIWVTVRE